MQYHVKSSVSGLRPVPGGIEFRCACMHTIQVEFTVEPGATTWEFAVTCDECMRAHWFTVTIGQAAT